ncbi:MAG: EamA family transporter [Okeania sp. SIO3H1]|nr:EamA family transporter [Okeania sp. SIO3H1]
MMMTRQTDPFLLAALIMVAGMAFIPIGDSFAKLLSEASPFAGATVAWMRFGIGALVAVPLTLAAGEWRNTPQGFWRVQLIRSLALCVGIGGMVTSVQTIEIHNAFGAFFVGPAVATILTRLVLKEAVTPLEWAAVALGFLGVLLVVQPTTDLKPGILWALFGGVGYGAFLVATRWAAKHGRPLGQLAGQLTIGFVLLTPLSLWAWPSGDALSLISWPVALFILGSGLASAAGNMLTIVATRMVRAARLMPFVYFQLFSAAIVGWLIFGDIPNLLAVIGLAIIASAGALQFLSKQARTPENLNA